MSTGPAGSPEAVRVLGGIYRALPFLRPCFDRAIETTDRAVAEVDRLRRSAEGLPADSPILYAEVGEVFKLGSAAVCTALERKEHLDRVGRCCDHLAMASRIPRLTEPPRPPFRSAARRS